MDRLLFFASFPFLCVCCCCCCVCPCGWKRFSSVSILQVKWRHAWRSFSAAPAAPLCTPLFLSLLPEPWQIPARFYNISTFLNSHSHLHVRWHTLKQTHTHTRTGTHTGTHTDCHTHLSKPTACMFLMGGTKGYLMLTKI